MPEPLITREEKTVGRSGFLGGLLALVSLVALSIVGVGHARSLEGAANAQFWIVVLIAAVALAVVTLALSRASARTPGGEFARRIGVALAALWLVVFVWETLAIGTDAFSGPLELVWRVWKG